MQKRTISHRLEYERRWHDQSRYFNHDRCDYSHESSMNQTLERPKRQFTRWTWWWWYDGNKNVSKAKEPTGSCYQSNNKRRLPHPGHRVGMHRWPCDTLTKILWKEGYRGNGIQRMNCRKIPRKVLCIPSLYQHWRSSLDSSVQMAGDWRSRQEKSLSSRRSSSCWTIRRIW